MSDGYDYRRHGSDFPTLRDDEIEFLCQLLYEYGVISAEHGGVPRRERDAHYSLFLKATNAAAQRKIPPYGG